MVSPTNFVTSAYSHPQSTPHYATKWEIRTRSGNYEEPVLRVTTTNSFLTSYPIPFDQLTYGQTYCWRATYIDTNYHPSIVSAETILSWGTSNTTAGTLVLNEVLANNRSAVQNSSTIADYYPDYVELRNNGSAVISLAGYALTDNPLLPAKYVFPAGATIAAGGYLLVWCDSDTNTAGLHSGFKLDGGGDQILLLNGSIIVDSLAFGPQAPDVSLGRIVNGSGGWQANTPTPGTANSAKTLGSVSNLRINEWMADLAYGDDWFEIYNPDTHVVALAGLYLSDTPSTPMITQIPPLSFIEGKGFTRFWADGSADSGSHCNFKLSKSGESLVLTAANGATTIDTVTFSAQTTDVSQGRLPDGSITIVSFSSQTASPGYMNWAPASVYINEVLSHTASPFEDAVEIYNPTPNAISIGGWWLSDYRMMPQKFQIPAGTTLPAGGYAVFYKADFQSGAVPFALGKFDDEIVLSAVDGNGTITGYGSYVHFPPSAASVSFGRVAATGLNAESGGAEFWPLAAHTFGQDNPSDVAAFRTGTGAANAMPKIGPIVINEIMYHPFDITNVVSGVTNILDDTTNEFIELFNVTNTAVDLSGWRITGDTEYTFATNTALPARGFLLLVSFDPADAAALASFRTTYGLTNNAQIYGPYSKNLANSTAKLELEYPATFDGYSMYVRVDKVEYRDLSPWPTKADGKGRSLQRASLSMIGNTAANWAAEPPTPAAINLGMVTNIAIATTSPLIGGVVGSAYSSTFAATGGSEPYSWTITVGSVAGLSLGTIGVLSGTPTTAGTNVFTVQVADRLGATATQQFTLIIADTAPSITTASPLPSGTIGVAYSQTLAATGGTRPYAWTLFAGTMPGGVTLNGTGVISGTPTNYGTFNFAVQVSDGGGLTTTRAFAISITVPPLVITSVSPMVSGQQGVAYSQALTAVGGIAPYTWTIPSGSLPPGLNLSSLGDITGTPTTSGTCNFTAQVTDSASNAVSKALAITIISPSLTITTDVLPDSIVGASYSQPLAAAGGTAPYTWSIVWGALPDGLSLSNLNSTCFVSGTPTTAGTFSFIVQVADTPGASTTEMFTIEIQNNAPIISFEAATNSTIQLLISGDAGPNYAIEASTNLVDWETILITNTPAMPFRWAEPGASNSAMFYRALVNP